MFHGITDWFRCRLCDARFPSYRQARRHVLAVHRVRPGDVTRFIRYDEVEQEAPAE